MADSYHTINDGLLDIHTQLITHTKILNEFQDPVNMPDIIHFVKNIYHVIYDVWKVSSLSNEYYYNILVSLEKYVCAISFRSLLLVEPQEYDGLWYELDDMIVFLEEEYDYFDIYSILEDLETAADVFSAALVIPTNNIYTRLVELRQVLNMVYRDNPNLEEDYMFSLNMKGYFKMNTISSNKAIIRVQTYYRQLTDDEGRREFFAVPSVDPDEPEFDDIVAEFGGIFDHFIVRRMFLNRGRNIERDSRVFLDEIAVQVAYGHVPDFNTILQFMTAALFTLHVFIHLPMERIVNNLLEFLKLIPVQDLVTVGDEVGVQEGLLHIIFLTNEIRLDNLGLACVDAMLNYAELLCLVKLRVQFPDTDATILDEYHHVVRDRDPRSPAMMLAAFGTMDFRRYDTLKKVVVSLGRKYCSLCKTSDLVEDYALTVYCPHLLCSNCLHHWITKSSTFTCPVCRTIIPKMLFGHDFLVLKWMMVSVEPRFAHMIEEFYRILKRLL